MTLLTLRSIRAIDVAGPKRLVLSRKGCDSTSGGCDSPILPNGKLVSLPVPAAGIPYEDIQVAPGLSCARLMRELGITTLKNAWLGEMKHAVLPLGQAEAHFDPDLEPSARPRGKGWRPTFGQVGSPQGELRNQQIQKGDLFLFFGRFRWTEGPKDTVGRRRWIDAPLHVLWGWLEVDRVIDVNSEPTPPWAVDFPHVKHRTLWANAANVIYVATNKLSFEPSLPGGGVFRSYRDEFRLTRRGGNLLEWELPAAFDGVRFSHLRQVGAVEAGRTTWDVRGQWQEAVGQTTDEILEWVRLLLRNEAAVHSSGRRPMPTKIPIMVLAIFVALVTLLIFRPQ